MIDFDAVRLDRLRSRAEAVGLGLVQSESAADAFALYSYDRRLYVAEHGVQPGVPELTLTEVDAVLSDIESRLQLI